MTVQPHPVARLLTPEMKARVKAATFVRWGSRVVASASLDGRTVCPLGVALGWPCSPSHPQVFEALGVSDQQPGSSAQARIDLRAFMYDVDSGAFDPADIHALLGCGPGEVMP